MSNTDKFKIISKCSCGFHPRICKSKHLKSCSVTQALCNHIMYPSSRLFPDEEDGNYNSSIYYNDGDYKRMWATIVELDLVKAYGNYERETRQAFNIYGEPLYLSFYKDFEDEDEKPTTFAIEDFDMGNTFVMLTPMTNYGHILAINYANVGKCFIFKAPLRQVLKEAMCLLRDADSKHLNQLQECFGCGIKREGLLRCSKCKLAKYCSKVCKQLDIFYSC